MIQGFNEVKASSIAGVSLDCDLSTGAKIGGGMATDNTAALNALLATASALNPLKLILDGPTLVTGLVISAAGYTDIEGIGWTSGIYIKSGSNADPINNGKILPFDPNTTPPASGKYVRLANFMINGNQGNGTTGDSTSGDPRGAPGVYWYCNINLCNLNGVRIENMYIFDAPSYSIRLNNCSDAVVAFNTIISPSGLSNNDGIHVDGPATDVRVIGNYINNNFSDDAIAFNANEGYGGLIDRCAVIGNTFQNTLSAMRVDGTATGQVGSIAFQGNTGNTSNCVLLIGGAVGTGDQTARSLIASGNSFSTIGNFLHLEGNSGDIVLADCTWLSPTAAGAFISPILNGTSSSVTVNNCRIYRTAAGNNTGAILLSSAAGAFTFKKLTINGFYVVNEQGGSYAAIAEALAMTNVTVSQLFIATLDYTNITALADSYTNIASISGQGWQPETNIQNKTAAYTLLPTDRTVFASTTAGSFAVALPAVAYAGEKHTIKNTGTANTLTVTGTVDGSANPTLATLAKLTVEYDGTHWWSL